MKQAKVFLLLGLMVLLFALQSFDWFHLENNPCDFYEFDPNCLAFGTFAMNKFIRLSFNVVIIWLIQWFYFPGNGKHFLYLVIGILGFGALDFYLMLHPSFVAMRLHGFMHPLAFSPLIAMVVLAFQFIQFNKEV
jgi:hypothetical protein